METEKEVPVPADTDTELLLVTANVGSLFEDPTRLLQIWLKEFIAKVSQTYPKFLGLHLQEVGGKTYEKSMEYVQEFIRCLCDAMEDYIYVYIYMDEDFKSAEHFTALGNIYFAHRDLASLRIWNFLTHSWEDDLSTAEDKRVYSGNIETIPTKEKSKFPQHFFPECKWSRKGFMRTRWEINGTVIDLVNIHLFHDASNLVACDEFPSVYCKTRRRALVHTLERFHLDDKNGSVPFFLFGDFNFRCDTEGVVKELTQNLTAHRVVQSAKSENTKIHYRNTVGHNVLTVGKKEFSHADHQLKFKEDWLKKFDRELEPLKEILVEYPIAFMPSYPFEEDPEMPTDYMSTRCPSWCDRILMSPQVKDVITEDGHINQEYNMIGESVCMGDHKPIYLTVRLKPNKGTYRSCDCNYTYTNNNNTTSPGPTICEYCPYTNALYKKILYECRELNKTNECSSDLISDENKNEESSASLNQIQSDVKDIRTSQAGDFQKTITASYPEISINIIDSDNIYVCMCSQLSSNVPENPGSSEPSKANGSICPVCRNIIKQQPIEHRYRLISKRLILSKNIIVNRIDTQHLNTYLEHSRDDPYTPESTESHSPYPELNSTSTTTSSNSRSPFDPVSHESLRIQNIVAPIKSKEDYLKPESQGPSSALNLITDNHSRGIVTPGQLKSRLEDLQRMSMNSLNSEKDGMTVGKGDVVNVETICTSKPVSKPHERNSSFPNCCNLH